MSKLPKKKYRELAKMLNAMARADQRYIKSRQEQDIGSTNLFKKHTAGLKMIISRYGWPTINKVGEKASRSAWLIAQHSDHDINFQKECLKTVQEENNKNNSSVARENIAFLTDRVLINEGKEQLFGTQFVVKGKKILQPFPIKDRNNLNKRRRAFGLPKYINYGQAG